MSVIWNQHGKIHLWILGPECLQPVNQFAPQESSKVIALVGVVIKGRKSNTQVYMDWPGQLHGVVCSLVFWQSKDCRSSKGPHVVTYCVIVRTLIEPCSNSVWRLHILKATVRAPKQGMCTLD
eukprot:Blabericola_migrator_1__8918@NODE_4722_length_1008_cov_3_934113_g2935_i0_p1_GENE_NODE_4722_length_1008_cov_3_934113_g2935_i0NODE_4722_length_1008_cov_3_934113_g2935_i0_p1_ORF_typecomplete_len123_score4_98_NODE_4722_length_1008_cov_3_934113_g2935_i0265633